MAQSKNTPELRLLEEATIVLFCLIEDAYNHTIMRALALTQ